jgi:hypothetical protein
MKNDREEGGGMTGRRDDWEQEGGGKRKTKSRKEE